MAKKDSMPKKDDKAKKEKVTEDLTPEKDPKGGATSSATLATPSSRPTVPIRDGLR